MQNSPLASRNTREIASAYSSKFSLSAASGGSRLKLRPSLIVARSSVFASETFGPTPSEGFVSGASDAREVDTVDAEGCAPAGIVIESRASECSIPTNFIAGWGLRSSDSPPAASLPSFSCRGVSSADAVIRFLAASAPVILKGRNHLFRR
jgi:hypothetical protein